MPSTEVCDYVDNNCDGVTDEGFSLSDPTTCGTCENNCFGVLANHDPITVACTPVTPGVPGACTGQCAEGWVDLDADPSTCETFCFPSANDDASCNYVDDDCDGSTDEDVDLCTSTSHCGACGFDCTLPHAISACIHTGAAACDPTNTACAVTQCVCNGPGDCWVNIDGVDSNGCEVPCSITNGGVEICDGLDNDCDGLVDALDDLSGDTAVGVPCAGDPDGACADPSHAGVVTCVGGVVSCQGPNVLRQGMAAELCNNVDDDCDGLTDNNPTDVSGPCGSNNTFPCSLGSLRCQDGRTVCVGAVEPSLELCNGVDDDCDGVTDSGTEPTSDSGGACDVSPPAPAGATSPCRAGTLACLSGALVCQDSVVSTGGMDTCGVDQNCDGTLTMQPDTETDVDHCGGCGLSCRASAVHANWSCQSRQCLFQGCEPGYYDNGGPGDAVAGDNKCGYACTFVSAQESCNGVDDNCDGQIDEGVVAPSPTAVCGVSPAAAGVECTSGVNVSCLNGAWRCTFPANVCNPTCAAAAETCDAVDNNCNGLVNENVPLYGQSCASDDAVPGTHGRCRTTGTYLCSGPNSVSCGAIKADCNSLPGGCTEACDGVDNDCDGATDETFQSRGANAANFVKPTVTKIGASLWIMSYEASRPNSSLSDPGRGNGYHCDVASCPATPLGVTLDKTKACSVPQHMPWFNVTPAEAEQTCAAMGGGLCTEAQWQQACQATTPCTWGYNPRGAACTSAYTASKFCNLGPSYDGNALMAGDQNVLQETASPVLANCWADWANLQGNNAATNKIYDITGNLREITKGSSDYMLGGASFVADSDQGGACAFSAYRSSETYSLYDVGFRCCFTTDPTL
ncbi:MAG: MopE-related protein [Myxococcota bacterium]